MKEYGDFIEVNIKFNDLLTRSIFDFFRDGTFFDGLA